MRYTIALAAVTAVAHTANPLGAAELCVGYGPQTPRDITSVAGENRRLFTPAPPANAINLCNLHFHVNAEHKGPGFSEFAGEGEHGGYRCDATASLSEAELADPGEGGCHGVKPGDTIEVHWVHTSCDAAPGAGLGACLTPACANPELRVEAQVFLVVNDTSAVDFTTFDYVGRATDGLHRAKALPEGTGEPVQFAGSSTGPNFTDATCSPLQVTWNVRPACAKLDIASLHRWCEANAFDESHGHGVRSLVTNIMLLSRIGE